MLYLSLFLALALILANVGVNSLDVSFIPNDENAPLPLSAKYRASLRRLCTLLKESSPDTPSPILADLKNDPAKQRALHSLCKKLAADDANIAMGAQESGFLSNFLSAFTSFQRSENPQWLWLSVGLGGLGVAVYSQREKLRKFSQRWLHGNTRVADLQALSGGAGDDKPEDSKPPSPSAMREARLKRFAPGSTGHSTSQ
eukprot:gene10877-7736_t